MTEDARTGPFHWEMYRSTLPRRRDWDSAVVGVLLHVVGVAAPCVVEPLVGLALGTVFAVFWGSLLLPPWLRDRRSVVAADIRPGPPAVLVLRRRNGREVTHPLASVTGLRPLTVGHRSVDSSGQSILELRAGGRVHRTQAAFNPPQNDVRLLAGALRLACRRMVVGEHEDRTTWVTDGG